MLSFHGDHLVLWTVSLCLKVWAGASLQHPAVEEKVNA